MVNSAQRSVRSADQIAACPKLLSELVFWPERAYDAIAYRIEVPSRAEFFTVSREDYVFISLLDGTRTPEVACGAAAAALRSDAISRKRARALVHWLQDNELLASGYTSDDSPFADTDPSQSSTDSDGHDPNNPRSSRSLRHAERSDAKPRSWWQIVRSLNPLAIKTPLPGLASVASDWSVPLMVLFKPPCVLVAVALMLMGLMTVAVDWRSMHDAMRSIYGPGLWASTIVSWLALRVLHELAHVAAARRYGVSVSGVGIVWVLFAPLFYVDVTNSWRLHKTWRSIVIAAAGMYVELIVAAIAVLVWKSSDSPLVQYWSLSVALAASVSTVLFNANPLMRFDGYYILTDGLRLPNLSREASQCLRDFAGQFFFASSPGRHGKRVGWRRWFIIAYAIAAAAWRVVVCVSLSASAISLFDGVGVVMVVVAMGCWLVPSVVGGWKAIAQQLQSNPAKVMRGLGLCFCLVVLAHFAIFVVPVQTAIRVPAVLQWNESTVVRSPVEGFVESILVSDGQKVQAGDVLLRLSNDELEYQASMLNVQIQQCMVRRRIAADEQSASQVMVQREQEASLREQLQQIDRRRNALQVTAQHSGIVVARQLHALDGCFVNEGDPLMVVAEPADRHVLASVAQKDLHSTEQMLGQSVVLSDGEATLAEGILRRIKPGASNDVPHDALSGINDGPLAVRPVRLGDESSGQYELLSPRFQAIIDLPPEAIDRLPVGKCVEVRLGNRQQTIATRLRLWFDQALSGS